MEKLGRDLIEYFIIQTNKKFESLDQKFDQIDLKLETLLKFKWQIVGGSVVMSTLFSMVISFLIAYLSR